MLPESHGHLAAPASPEVGTTVDIRQYGRDTLKKEDCFATSTLGEADHRIAGWSENHLAFTGRLSPLFCTVLGSWSKHLRKVYIVS